MSSSYIQWGTTASPSRMNGQGTVHLHASEDAARKEQLRDNVNLMRAKAKGNEGWAPLHVVSRVVLLGDWQQEPTP